MCCVSCVLCRRRADVGLLLPLLVIGDAYAHTLPKSWKVIWNNVYVQIIDKYLVLLSTYKQA